MKATTRCRIIAGVCAAFAATSAGAAWIFEIVPNQYVFDHSFRFFIAATVIVVFMITVIVRGKWPGWIDSKINLKE